VTICGTDLHILGGDVPEVRPGRVLGHEAVGTVVEVGAASAAWPRDDRVLASCISACGICRYCREGATGSACGGGGWILGHLVDGVQSEYARIPFADLSTYKLPEQVSDEAAVLLADILPTSYEVGVLNGRVGPATPWWSSAPARSGWPPWRPRGCTRRRTSSSIDKAESRLQAAKLFGADTTVMAGARTRSRRPGADRRARRRRGDRGGRHPQTFELCTTLVRPGGRVANIGVHGKPATLHLEDLWIRNVTITTGLVDTYSTPKLLDMLVAGQLDLGHMVTHRFGARRLHAGVRRLRRPGRTGALKVVLSR
jgi:alcohol dehydrogenase